MEHSKNFFLFILSLIAIGIFTIFFVYNKQDFKYQLQNKKENCFYDVYDMETKLVLLKKCKESKEIDSIIFYKNKDEYFQRLFNLAKRLDEQKLILSVKKPMIYYYGPKASFYCKIEQIGKNKFKTSLGNKDTLDSKYRFAFYYSNNYKISRIEYVLDDKVENYYSVSD